MNHAQTRRMVRLTAMSAALVAVAACGSATTSSHSASSASSSAAVPAAVLSDLAPSGRLRVGIPAAPPIFAVKDPTSGVMHGIGVDLATALGRQLGVPVDTVSYPDPGGTIDAAQSGAWDVGILPLNPKAATVADLTSPFLLLPHTYLVRADSAIHTVADADQPGIRIASQAGSPHTAALTAQLKHAKLVPVDSTAAGLRLLATGQADTYADARSALRGLAAQVPGSRLVTDDFFVARFALAVPRGHATGQAFLARFVEAEKASGFLQQAIDRLGKPDIAVAPAAS